MIYLKKERRLQRYAKGAKDKAVFYPYEKSKEFIVNNSFKKTLLSNKNLVHRYKKNKKLNIPKKSMVNTITSKRYLQTVVTHLY